MKSKADKHREAGTLDLFRARQAASRAGTLRYQANMRAQIEAASRLEAEFLSSLLAQGYVEETPGHYVKRNAAGEMEGLVDRG